MIVSKFRTASSLKHKFMTFTSAVTFNPFFFALRIKLTLSSQEIPVRCRAPSVYSRSLRFLSTSIISLIDGSPFNPVVIDANPSFTIPFPEIDLSRLKAIIFTPKFLEYRSALCITPEFIGCKSSENKRTPTCVKSYISDNSSPCICFVIAAIG